MYSVHVTTSGKQDQRRCSSSSNTPDSEVVYRDRRNDSIPLRVFNYIKQQFHSETPTGTY